MVLNDQDVRHSWCQGHQLCLPNTGMCECRHELILDTVFTPSGYNCILFSQFFELYQGLLKSDENFDLLYSRSPVPFSIVALDPRGVQQGQEAGSPDVTKSNLTVNTVLQVCNSTSQFYILCTVFPYSLDPQSDVSPNENKCPYPLNTLAPAPSLHSAQPDRASPSIWFLIPSLTSCLSVESSCWCLFPSDAHVYLTLHPIQ